MFRTVPLSIIRSFSLYTQQWYMSYRLQLQLASRIRTELVPSWSCLQAVSKPVWHTIAVCTVKNSWWWTEELSETCRVLFQKQISEISASSWFYYKRISSLVGRRVCSILVYTELCGWDWYHLSWMIDSLAFSCFCLHVLLHHIAALLLYNFSFMFFY